MLKYNMSKMIIIIIVMFILSMYFYRTVEYIDIGRDDIISCKIGSSKVNLNGEIIEVHTDRSAFFFGDREDADLKLEKKVNIFGHVEYVLIDFSNMDF